jgi:hypothetical protein
MENIMRNVTLRTFILASVVALLSFVFAEDTSSGYDSSQDVTITVDNPVTNEVAETLGVGQVGDALFNTQEGVHKTVENTTGQSVNHYYVKLCLGKSCLPIDPFKPHRVR